MQTKSRIAVVGSVFLLAFGTGWMMQHADAVATLFGGSRTLANAEADAPPLIAPAVSPAASPETGVPLPRDPLSPQLGTPATATFADRMEAGLAPPAAGCDVTLSAERRPAAMIALAVNAPCYSGQTVEIRHDTLRFSGRIDAAGELSLSIPALLAEAVIDVVTPDGAEHRVATEVPEADRFERIGLQWRGDSGLGLHAFEFGAEYGQAGHIHAGAAHSPSRALLTGAGFLTLLGDSASPDGRFAEIYSFPAEDGRFRGTVRVAIEAEVTRGNCGRAIAAQSLQPVLGTGLEALDLTLTMPGCDATGDILVLNDVLRDVQLAAN